MRMGGARFFLATSLLALATSAHGSEAITYSYDSLGHLIKVTRSGTVNAHYCYDTADNRTLVSTNQAAAPQCPASAPPPPPPADEPPPPPPTSGDPPPPPPDDPPEGPPLVDAPVHQKKPVPADAGGGSPPPAEPAVDPGSDAAPSRLIAFAPWSGAEVRPGPSGTRGGAA